MPHCPLTYSSAAARTRTPGGGNVSRAKNTPHLPCINFTLYAPRCGTCSARSSLMKNGWDGLSLHNTSSIIVFT